MVCTESATQTLVCTKIATQTLVCIETATQAMVCTEKTTEQHRLGFVQTTRQTIDCTETTIKSWALLAYPGSLVGVKCAGVGEHEAQILEETVGVGVPVT